MQRVIIPKGLVNPNETTIVEIPGNYKNVATVVAKPKGAPSPSHHKYPSSDQSASSPEMTPPGRKVKKRTYVRKTYPPLKHIAGASFDAYTFGGRPNEESADESSHGFHPYEPKAPYSPELTYGNFNPQLQSTLADISYEEGTLYRDFRPRTTATRRERASSPGVTPPSMEKYHSGAGATRITRKTSVTKTSPGEVSQEEITEESYGPETESPISRSSPGGYGPTSTSGSAYYSDGSYKELSDIAPTSKAYRPFGTTPNSGCSAGGGSNLTQDDLMNSLGQIETSEMKKIMGDLSSYQNARRRLLFDASSLATAADVSGSILNTSGSQ